MAYDNNNTGMLAKNERMREGKKDPEYTGFVNIDGQEYWLKAWVREGKEGSRMEGKKFFSLALDPKDDDRGGRGNSRGNDRGGNRSSERPARSTGGNRAPQQEQRGGFDDMDDDIPF